MLVMNSFIHSFILTDQGSDSQTTGSTLKGHLLAHLALAPTKCIFLYFPFVHFGFSCPQFFAQHLTKFHQLPQALPYSSHEYSDFDFCYLVRLLAGWQAPVLWPSCSPAPCGGIAQGLPVHASMEEYFQPNSGSPKSFNH